MKYKQTRSEGFPSKMEAAVYEYLQKREFLGEITDIKRQQTVVLQDGAPDVKIQWRLDFSFVHKASGEVVYAEAKGFATPEYKLKLKLWRKNPPAALEIYGGRYDRFNLVERIEALETQAPVPQG